MRYMLLAHDDQPLAWDHASLDAITASGELIDCARLAHPCLGTRLSVTSDAPLAGYVVVECESVDRARGIARTLAPMSAGVEVRPLMGTAGLEM